MWSVGKGGACRGKQDRKIILLPTSLAAQLNLPKGPPPPPPASSATFAGNFYIISSRKEEEEEEEKKANAKRERPFVVAIKKFRLFCNNIMGEGVARLYRLDDKVKRTATAFP